jgi:tripartite-type tricarboxylate transporter receptor subunit TctC
MDGIRRALVLLPLLAATLPRRAIAEQFPSRPIRLIVPYPPGGTSSMVLNLLAKLLDAEGVSVVLDFKPGAGGIIGVDYVLKAAPDGYTVGFTAMNSFAINPHLTKRLPYDVSKDVQLITIVGGVPNVLVVNPEVQARTLQDLVALSKTKDLSYAIPGGPGTSIHLSGELLVGAAHLKMTAVPYKGDSPALVDVMGGRVPVMMSNLTAVADYVKSGRLRALAVTSAKRSPLLPDVPTVAESGWLGFEVNAYFNIFTARGVAAPVLDTLNRIFNKAIANPEFHEQMATIGMDATGSTIEAASALTDLEWHKWGEVVRRTGITWD